MRTTLAVFVVCLGWVLSVCKANQCPSSNYCSCSKDLTLVTCTNRKLNDQSLIYLQNQLPSTTIVLNLSSNSLTSISSLSNLQYLQTLDVSYNRIQSLPSNLFSRFPQLSSVYLQENSLKTIPKSFNRVSNIHLDLSGNPLNCQCHLKWLIKWFETINLLSPIQCQKGLKLTEQDFCSNDKDEFHIYPDQSQLVYENDPFTLNCSSSSDRFWTFNEEFYSNNATIMIDRLSTNHSGLWSCHSLNSTRSISVHVLKARFHHFCQSIHMETSKGSFNWARTLTGQTIDSNCPFGSAAWFEHSSNHAKAFYTCSANRQWIDLDLSQCAFRTNISREFDRLLSRNQTNLLSTLVNWISKIDLNLFQFDDIVFLIDLIEEEHEKYRFNPQKIDEISMFIYRLSDYILQIDEKFEILPQYQMALRRLRLILEHLLDLANRSWLYVGKQLTAMTLESPLPPTVCFIPNRPLLTIICGIVNRQYKRQEARLATIQFVLSSNGSINQTSVYRIIIYRQTRLFSTNPQRKSNPVIYMKSVSSNNDSSIKLTFYDQSHRASIVTWNSTQNIWLTKSSVCKLDQQNIDMIATNCVLSKNHSFSITYLNDFNEMRSLFLNSNYLELAISVSSVIASICLFISIIFYVTFHKVYLMPRSFFHCLINYWLSLTILLPLFAFGIRQSQILFLCQLIAVGLHYFCLTTIIWLTLLSYCIWQKLYIIWSGKGHGGDDEDNPGGKSSVTIVDYDDDGLPIIKIKPKPIIQFYFLAYGIAFIVCGINVAISRDQYVSNKICFLNNFESLLTIIIPMCIFACLLLIFLLAARINIKRLTKEAIRLRDLPDEPEIEGELITGTDENLISSKPNESVPIILPSNSGNAEENAPHIDCRQSHLDSLCSSDMDHQHQPSNQLLSILFQLVLLILIFLSSISIYLHPLRPYHIRFEHSIYSHLYGFFVLLLGFYVLSFYVLSRSDLTLHFKYYHCFSNRNKKRLLNQSYTEPPPPPQTPQHSPSTAAQKSLLPTKENDAKIIFNQNLSGDESFTEQMPPPSPPHSHYSSSVYNCQKPQSNEVTTASNAPSYGSKYQATIASKYYARHRHMLKNSVSTSETSLQKFEGMSTSKLQPIEQESNTLLDGPLIEMKSNDDRLTTKSTNSPKEIQSIPIDISRFPAPPIISPRMAIRPSNLPLTPRTQASPSQAIIRPLPIVRHASPNVNKPLPNLIDHSPKVFNGDILANACETGTGRNSYRIMPSPSTEERHATYVYLNKNSNLIQQESIQEDHSSSLWKKPIDSYHTHVAYIDEDEEGSVSLKSNTTTTSSNTTSPTLSRKERSRTISSSSSSSSTFSNLNHRSNIDNNQIILHESSV